MHLARVHHHWRRCLHRSGFDDGDWRLCWRDSGQRESGRRKESAKLRLASLHAVGKHHHEHVEELGGRRGITVRHDRFDDDQAAGRRDHFADVTEDSDAQFV